jgi:hypothetical protein
MRLRSSFWSLGVLASAAACSPTTAPGDDNVPPSSGGQVGVGGTTPPAAGGAPFASGGAPASSGGSGGSVGAGGGAAGGSGGSGGSAAGGGPGPSEFVYDFGAPVEDTGTDCVVPDLADPSELPSNSKLPDPFKRIDGTTITKKSDWHCRRAEIRAQAMKYIYGDKPTPEVVTGTVTNSSISVHVEAEGTPIDYQAGIVLPPGEGPFPAIINIGAGGLTLGQDRILGMGVAIIYYDHTKIGTEGQPEQSRGDPNPGKFYDIYGGDHSAGLLMAWAWGASRLIDVLEASDGSVIDWTRLGVTGCSRNGKGAFAVGLFDERIALTIPHETSTAGVPLYRMVDILGQERTDHNYFGLNWLSNNFEPFVYDKNTSTSNAVKLPIDTHSLVAAIAPRGLLVLENPGEPQMGAQAGHTATIAGAEVWSALGVLGNLSYHSAVPDTGHCVYKNEYTELITANVSRFLKHEGEAPGVINPGPGGEGDLAEWKDWETPTLE